MGPRNDPFSPPEVIVKNKIAMAFPSIPHGGFDNNKYDKQMENKNKLLKDNVVDINEYAIKYDKYEPDICIVGSGPGGSALAYRLSEKLEGKKILVLEEGNLHTSDDFNQLEKDMIPNLYQSPPVRFSDDFGVAVFQGKLIGGSAVLNHAVCYEAPTEITETWGQNIGKELEDGGYYADVNNMIHYKQIYNKAINYNSRIFQKRNGQVKSK